MGENHKIRFPTEVEVFYVSPPALNEIKRWLRNQVQRSDKDKDETDKDEVASS